MLSNSNCDAPYVQVSSIANGDAGDALKDRIKHQILEGFEEGIQALRMEQNKTDTWMVHLRQELQQLTSEILVSFERVEAQIGRSSFDVNDMHSASHLSLSPGKRGYDLCPPSNLLSHASSKSPASPASVATSTSKTVDNEATIHHQILNKLADNARRSHEYKKQVEHHCACYHTFIAKESFFYKSVHSNLFNRLSAAITALFSIAVGLEADMQIKAALDGKSSPLWIERVVTFLNIWFVLEVALRLLAEGHLYFMNENEWRWNIFDLLIALLSVLDMFVSIGSVALMRMLRALKVAKALRVVRLFRMFHDLRLLIASMLSSSMSLIWSMFFLVVIIYIVAVCFVQAAVVHVRETSGSSPLVASIELWYSSLTQAMYTLLTCITGGIDWADAADPVWDFGWIYGFFFIAFVLVCLLGILNVVTSVFIEHASNMKKHDRDYAVGEELRNIEQEITSTMNLFDELIKSLKKNSIDSIESSPEEIAVGDLVQFLKKDRVIAHFAAIGIEISDRTYIANALAGPGGSREGWINVRDFVSGCLSLRGTAKQSDTLNIIMEVKKLETVVARMKQDIETNFKLLADMGRVASRTHMLNQFSMNVHRLQPASPSSMDPNQNDINCLTAAI